MKNLIAFVIFAAVVGGAYNMVRDAQASVATDHACVDAKIASLSNPYDAPNYITQFTRECIAN